MSAKATKNSIIIATCIVIVAVILTTSLILSGVVFRSALAATSYTITYDANGGTLTGSSSVSATAGSTITLPNVSKVGYSAKWIDQTAPSGTAITTASQLAGISSSGTYYLANDIDLSGYSSWTPISSFSGTLDGRGFAIKNLKITSTSTSYVGLFATTSSATIKNVKLENVNINVSNSGRIYVGAFVGNPTSVTIKNCYVSGTLQAYGATGFMAVSGFVGFSDDNCSISNSTNNARLDISNGSGYDKAWLGAFCGLNSASFSVSNCVNLADITVTKSVSKLRIGAFVGVNDNSSDTTTLVNCYNIGNIKYTAGTSSTIGGFLGGLGNLSCTNCFTAGDITGGNGGCVVYGSVAGSASVTNCYYLSGLKINGSTVSGTQQSCTAVSTVSDLASKFYNNMSSDDKAVWNYTTGSYPTIKVFDFNLSGNIGDKKVFAGDFSHTIKATYTANKYTVTLNNQSATTAGSTSVVATFDSAMPALTKPVRTNWVFAGYWTEVGGKGTQYYNADGSSTRTWNIANNTTLYAKWTSTINLMQEGGSGGSATVVGTWSMAMPTAAAPARSGYTFGGYYTNKAGAGTQYYNASMGSTHTYDLSNGQSLYAKWTSASIILDMQGGSDGTASINPIYNGAMPAATAPTRTGWTFGGYYTAIGGGGTQYYTKDMASAKNWTEATNVTLYAKWTTTISLNMDGGANGTASTVITYNAPMPSGLTAPTKTGYTFGGYYTESNGNGTKFYDDKMASVQNWTLAVNTALYAKWTPNVYVVTFEYNGATEGNTIASKKVNFGNFYSDLPLPSKAGSSFAGWYLENTYQHAVTSTTVVETASDHTIYAKWSTWLTLHVSGTSDSVSCVSEINAMYTKAAIEIYPQTGQYVSAISFDNVTFMTISYTDYTISNLNFALRVTYCASSISNVFGLDFEHIFRNYFDTNGSIHVYLQMMSTPYESLIATSGGGSVTGVAVGATYGGMAAIIGDNYKEMEDSDTIIISATVCQEGYKFVGWYAADNMGVCLSTDESFKIKKSLAYQRQLIAKFVLIGSSEDVNNQVDNS